MKSHLKRVSAPKTWEIMRKHNKFMIRPRPGACSQDYSLPLGVLLRDILKIAKTTKEVKRVLTLGQIKVNGKVRKDHKYPVGFMSVLSIPNPERNFRMIINKFNKLQVISISTEESKIRIAKIINKTTIGKGKTQVNLSDGSNIIETDPKKYKTSDTLVISIPEGKVKKHLSMENGAKVLLVKGKHVGIIGTVKGVKGRTITVKYNNQEIETNLEYAFVIGKAEAEITIPQ